MSASVTWKSMVLVGVTVLSLLQLMPVAILQNSPKVSRIDLSVNTEKPLRGQLLIVTGRLYSVTDSLPIPLVTVKLQYFRVGDANATREVTMITSSPSGLFQDLVNTTYLLRIGPWVVNASFASQLVYQSTSAERSFTIVVQPALSLYVYPHQVALGQRVDFNGLLFACIPCLDDNITVELIRPDNTSITVHLKLNATGGPYPGGYYDGKFVPDAPGAWHIIAVWAGNDVTLPTKSPVEELTVETPGSASTTFIALMTYIILAAALLTAVLLVARYLKKEKHVPRLNDV